MTDEFRVIAKDGRELFRGAERDVREFVETHFPHIHSPAYETENPPTPDAKVISPDGAESTYHGKVGGWSDAQNETPVATPDVTESTDFGGSNANTE